MLPGLAELDLSCNLIASWGFVSELAAALPSLTALNLSGNRLALPGLCPTPAALPGTPASSGLSSLQTLVLNECGVGWQQAVAVARLLPSLRELHLCGNRLASLQLPPDAAGGDGIAAQAADGGSPGDASALLAAAFSRLEVLDLEDNELSSWADVALLRHLPRLASLLLSGNRLAGVQYDAGGCHPLSACLLSTLLAAEQNSCRTACCAGSFHSIHTLSAGPPMRPRPAGFTTLQALLLGSNRLDSWRAVDQLDRFPALQDARLSDNPLTTAAPSSARYQCIARVRWAQKQCVLGWGFASCMHPCRPLL